MGVPGALEEILSDEAEGPSRKSGEPPPLSWQQSPEWRQPPLSADIMYQHNVLIKILAREYLRQAHYLAATQPSG